MKQIWKLRTLPDNNNNNNNQIKYKMIKYKQIVIRRRNEVKRIYGKTKPVQIRIN